MSTPHCLKCGSHAKHIRLKGCDTIYTMSDFHKEEAINVPGKWTEAGDFIPADGSAILRHDPNPTPERIGEDPELQAAIQSLPKLGQRQYDTTSQILHLISAAHKLGLYDAADVLRRYVEN